MVPELVKLISPELEVSFVLFKLTTPDDEPPTPPPPKPTEAPAVLKRSDELLAHQKHCNTLMEHKKKLQGEIEGLERDSVPDEDNLKKTKQQAETIEADESCDMMCRGARRLAAVWQGLVRRRDRLAALDARLLPSTFFSSSASSKKVPARAREN